MNQMTDMIILSCVIIALTLLFKVKRRADFKRKLVEFNGRVFLFYNNRSELINLFEGDLNGKLVSSVKPILLEGRTALCGKENKEFFKKLLWDLRKYKKFPHLVKIENGKIIENSINNLTYNIINGTQSLNELIDLINKFPGR